MLSLLSIVMPKKCPAKRSCSSKMHLYYRLWQRSGSFFRVFDGYLGHPFTFWGHTLPVWLFTNPLSLRLLTGLTRRALRRRFTSFGKTFAIVGSLGAFHFRRRFWSHLLPLLRFYRNRNREFVVEQSFDNNSWNCIKTRLTIFGKAVAAIEAR